MTQPDPQDAFAPDDPLAYLEALTPWPAHFGLGRIRVLLAELGDPQRHFRSIHVVGTNGKTSTTLMTAALLHGAGLRVGATISPHLTGWAERIQVDGQQADLGRAIGRVRPYATGTTQFELLTAAAFAEFAAAEVDVAVVEAGLGGRLDATNVLDAEVVVLTNVALEHTAVLGETREAIAAEKLAVISPGATAVLGEPEWEPLARSFGAARVFTGADSNLALALQAAEALLGEPVDPAPALALTVPGRGELRSGPPRELWDGAHNPAGVDYLLARHPLGNATVLASILADKDVEGMLASLARAGTTLVATASASPRALPAAELARVGAAFFAHVEAVPSPAAALERARVLAGAHGIVLVTGSIYLLGELYPHA